MLHSYSKALDKQDEMTRRISDAEKKQIDQELSDLKAVPETIHHLMGAMSKPHWEKDETNSINHPQMPLYALIAFQEKLISKNQFGTLLLYHSIRTYYSNNDKVTSTFFQFDTTIYPAVRDINDEINKLPPSDQIAFVIPFDPNELNIIAAVGQYINVLTLNVDLEKNQLRVPSLSIIQILINKESDYPVKMNPVIGLSSIDDIKKNGYIRTRDLALPFPHVKLPLSADYVPAPDHMFPIHDVYHSISASNVSPGDSKLFIETGEAVESLLTKKYVSLEVLQWFPAIIIEHIKEYFADPEDQCIQSIANYFYDMDLKYYSPFEQQSKLPLADKFWGTVVGSHYQMDQLNQVKYRLVNFTEFPVMTYESRKALIFNIFDYLTKIDSPYLDYLKDRAFLMDEGRPESQNPIENYLYDLLIFWNLYNHVENASQLTISNSLAPAPLDEKPVPKTQDAQPDLTEASVTDEKPVVKTENEQPDLTAASLPEAKEPSPLTTSTPAIHDRIMVLGNKISSTFDERVVRSLSQILTNQRKIERRLANAGISPDIAAGFAINFGAAFYNATNPYSYLLLPVADLSAKTLGYATYSVGSLVKHGVLFWRKQEEPASKVTVPKPDMNLSKG